MVYGLILAVDTQVQMLLKVVTKQSTVGLVDSSRSHAVAYVWSTDIYLK